MTSELSPETAASLALAVYAVNEGNTRNLKAFLSRREFSQQTGQSTLKGDIGGRIFRAAKDSFGLCAIGANQYKGNVFLIFRGTTTAHNNADMITDARIGIERSITGLPVHIGFNHTFKSMLPDIRKFISENKINGTIHCIGHSLGGAVATLAADWAASNTPYPVKLYTFGQPRVGLTFFSTMLTQKLGANNIHRVYHTTDPVPMVPVFPYLHGPLPGYGHRKMSENPIISGEAHRMISYTKGLGSSWESLVSAPPLHTHETAIEEWLKSNAYSNPMCPKTFEWLESAIIWLLKKHLTKITFGLQWAAMGIHTFLDKIAWVLAKGIEIGEQSAEYVKLFIRKVMNILGLKYKEGVTSITHAFFRFLLQSLVKRANDMAANAIRGLGI